MGAGLPPAPIFHFTTLLSDMTLHFEVISRFQAAANADAVPRLARMEQLEAHARSMECRKQ